jgi:hypothetical protein
MSLGRNASSVAIFAAMCLDVQVDHATLPEEYYAAIFASDYYGWNFASQLSGWNGSEC